MSDRVKVYVTKYALMDGIQKRVAEIIAEHNLAMVHGEFTEWFHCEGRDWHRTYEGARLRAEAMRLAKIKSLKKSIAKFEAMSFPECEPEATADARVASDAPTR